MLSSETKFVVFFLTLCLATLLAAAAYNRTISVQSKELFSTFDITNLPTWSTYASGKVGRDDTLNDNGESVVKRKLDILNRAGESCVYKGVTMPASWIPSGEVDTCGLDVYDHVVRNDCSNENDTLFVEGGILDDAYLDPNTKRCQVHFKGGESRAEVENYRREVDAEHLLSQLHDLRDQVSRMERRREELANTKSDLDVQVRENEDKLDVLQERVIDLEDEISALDKQISDLEDEIDALEKQLTDIRLKVNRALDGSKVNLMMASNGEKWTLGVDGRVRIGSGGREMCMTVVANDSRVYKSHEGMVAFFNAGSKDTVLRHRGNAMWAEPLNTGGPDYSFAFRLKYHADGTVTMENDHAGTSYVGFDPSSGEVRLYSDAGRAQKWKLDTTNECIWAPIVLGPPLSFSSYPGGWCCTTNGLRMVAFQPFRMGRTTIHTSRAGTIVVRLVRDHDTSSSRIIHTKQFSVVKGTQSINLDFQVPSAGNYYLHHDRRQHSAVRLYRASRFNGSNLNPYFRNYDNVVHVTNASILGVTNRHRQNYWYNFYAIEVFPSTITSSSPALDIVGPASKNFSRSGYRVLVFSNTGDANLLVGNRDLDVDVLVVAGGGGAGNVSRFSSAGSGGGGAGGLVFRRGYRLSAGAKVNVHVGEGASRQNSSSRHGNNGQDSRFGPITAVGGGGGGWRNRGGGPARDGGSGGGSRRESGGRTSGGKGTQGGTGGYGNDGGDGIGGGGNSQGGAGGGGASQAGRPNSGRNAGDGGGGFDATSFFGDSIGHEGWFAGGGAGGSFGGHSARGGRGGGGGGAGTGGTGGDGRPNTGGGGGGAGSRGGRPGKGGSGVIVVRYRE
jgi:predicted  nucleic acid-binding Zn-ribbon protein